MEKVLIDYNDRPISYIVVFHSLGKLFRLEEEKLQWIITKLSPCIDIKSNFCAQPLSASHFRPTKEPPPSYLTLAGNHRIDRFLIYDAEVFDEVFDNASGKNSSQVKRLLFIEVHVSQPIDDEQWCVDHPQYFHFLSRKFRTEIMFIEWRPNLKGGLNFKWMIWNTISLIWCWVIEFEKN